jgi:hypothetical protein
VNGIYNAVIGKNSLITPFGPVVITDPLTTIMGIQLGLL